MRTINDLDYDDVTDSDLIGYFKPSDIAEDDALPISRRRELLAFWGSDIHAVPDTPALRAYTFGAPVPIDDVFDALKSLDDKSDLPPTSLDGSGRVTA
jgi:hypothetical protein